MPGKITRLKIALPNISVSNCSKEKLFLSIDHACVHHNLVKVVWIYVQTRIMNWFVEQSIIDGHRYS